MSHTTINLAIQNIRVQLTDQQPKATMALSPSILPASFEAILCYKTHPPEPPTSSLLPSAQSAARLVQSSPQMASGVQLQQQHSTFLGLSTSTPPSPSCQAPSSTHHKWFRSFLILSPPPAHKPLITKPKHADIKPSLIQILAASPDTTASSTAQIAPKLPPSSPRSLRYSSLSHRYYFHRGRPPDDSTIRTS